MQFVEYLAISVHPLSEKYEKIILFAFISHIDVIKSLLIASSQ